MYRKRLAPAKGSTLLRIGFVVDGGGRAYPCARTRASASALHVYRGTELCKEYIASRIEIKIHRLLSPSQKTYDILYILIFRTGGSIEA